MDHSVNLRYCFLVVILDLYLFKETVLLNPCVKRSKNNVIDYGYSGNWDIDVGAIH